MRTCIQEHLLIFIKAHGCLPCPSQPALAPRDVKGTAQPQCCHAAIAWGGLPLKTLGITLFSPTESEESLYVVKTSYTKPKPTIRTTANGQVAFPAPHLNTGARLRLLITESGVSLVDESKQTIAALWIPKGVMCEKRLESEGSVTFLIPERSVHEVVVILDQNFPQ